MTFRAPINRLSFKDPIPAGMDSGVIAGRADVLATEHLEEPPCSP